MESGSYSPMSFEMVEDRGITIADGGLEYGIKISYGLMKVKCEDESEFHEVLSA